MKHLLRKLHIGAAAADPPSLTTSPPPATSSGAAESTGAGAGGQRCSAGAAGSTGGDGGGAVGSTGGGGEAGSTGGGGGQRLASAPPAGLGFLEEEYQVQLALALSASNRAGLEGPDSVQMNAATQLSLGAGSVDHLSQRYWSYNIVDYHEKLVDGFYAVHGFASNRNLQGQMPSLLDLQATSDNIDIEIVIVNRAADQALRQLEKRAVSIALESRVAKVGLIASGLIQKIANLVVDSMGGPVGDTDDMSLRWTKRSSELRTSLKTVILPLGSLDVGLSCHRSLLFKVLADRINLPCRLVRGSYYTGTDEGAINFIKDDNHSQYILDLMGAPGALIPAEILSDYFHTSGPKILNSSYIGQTTKDLCVVLDKFRRVLEKTSELSEGSSTVTLQPEEISRVSLPAAAVSSVNDTQRFEHDFGELPSLGSQKEALFENKETASPAQQMKLDDVSRYVVDAARNPEFAQKLHAILLKSLTPRIPNLFSELSSSLDSVHQRAPERSISIEREARVGGLPQNNLPLDLHSFFTEIESSYLSGSSNKEKFVIAASPKQSIDVIANGNQVHTGNHAPIGISGLVSDVTELNGISRNNLNSKGSGACHHTMVASGIPNQKETREMDSSKRQIANVQKALNGQCNAKQIVGNGERTNRVLKGATDWEIPWEKLKIGERIGIGSYGEVYRADWNGTEVAVKKFLDQDLSGDALEQIKSEIKIMLRLRHPNVILFMGAITCAPNLSILTEFLPRGSLYSLLHRPHVQLDEKRRLKMAADVAKGMNYLHTSHPTIVHRDLKSPNLLVDKNWIVKVCDFGLSQLKHHTFLSSKASSGTAEWMAPEVLRNEPSNEKCDVYSFGVILWELATLQMPWSGMNPMQVVGAVGFQNRRLDIPKEVDPIVAEIITDCCQNDPNKRPSFAQLILRLKQSKRLVVAVLQ